MSTYDLPHKVYSFMIRPFTIPDLKIDNIFVRNILSLYTTMFIILERYRDLLGYMTCSFIYSDPIQAPLQLYVVHLCLISCFRPKLWQSLRILENIQSCDSSYRIPRRVVNPTVVWCLAILMGSKTPDNLRIQKYKAELLGGLNG